MYVDRSQMPAHAHYYCRCSLSKKCRNYYMYNRTLDCYVCYVNAICTVSITNTNSEDTGRVTAHSVDDRPLSSKESSEREISVPLSPSTSFTVTRTAGDESSPFASFAGVRLISTCVSVGLARPSSAAARAFNRSRWAIMPSHHRSVPLVRHLRSQVRTYLLLLRYDTVHVL